MNGHMLDGMQCEMNLAKNYFILFMETWLAVQCVDDACEMVCPTYYQCMQSWRWCMWNDVPPLIISACNHDMERLKKFLSNLNNLFFSGLFFHNFYWPNTKSPFILVFFFLLIFSDFFFQSSATSSLETSFLILAPLAFLCRKVFQSWHFFSLLVLMRQPLFVISGNTVELLMSSLLLSSSQDIVVIILIFNRRFLDALGKNK